MALFRKDNSPYFHYSVWVDGLRYRGSTRKTTKTAAAAVEAAVRTSILQGGGDSLPAVSRGATLRSFSVRFLEWVRLTTELELNSRRYYEYGWRLLNLSPLATRRMDTITRDEIGCTSIRRPSRKDPSVLIPCSTSYTLQALRTLKVMLGKAVEWNLLSNRPRVPMPRPVGRDTLIDAHTDAALETAFTAQESNASVMKRRRRAMAVWLCVNDAGMRPDEVFPMLIEHMDFARQRIWIPGGKTPNAQRWVNMSDRMAELLREQCGNRKKGWVFPSKRAACGHLTTVARAFQGARERGKVASTVVLYSGRHTYGTYAMEMTGNVFAVSKSMGHGSIKSMEPYQHPNPDLDTLNGFINERNRRRDQLISEAAIQGGSEALSPNLRPTGPTIH